MKITLTHQELTEKKLNLDTLATAVEQVKAAGYVVFDKVIDENKIEKIRKSFNEIFEKYVLLKGFNTGTNRAQMYLPFEAPFIDEDIIANPIAISVIDKIIGENCTCTYFASDTPMPGSDYQNAHCDAMPLFPELSSNLPSYSLVFNVPLVDTTEENGPLEIWPGTHLNPEWAVHDTLDGSVNPHMDIVRAAKGMLSERVLMSAGSIVVRDVRTWHRGTPNRSNASRTNIALIYGRSWLGGGSTQIPQETYKSLSDRAQHLFRKAKIGMPVKQPWEY